MKKYFILFFALFSLIPSVSFAYVTISGEDQLRIEKPIEDNAYIWGGNVELSGDVKGDLYLAGGELRVKGDVSDNAFIAGGNIETNGTLGNDAFLAGGTIRVLGKIIGDAKIAGGSLSLENTASGDVMMAGWSIRIKDIVIIGKDLAVAGGDIVIDGVVKGKANIEGEKISLNGVFEKDVNLLLGGDKWVVTVGPNAKILGKLTYSAQSRIPALDKLASGKVEYTKITLPEWNKNKEMKNNFLGIITTFVVFRILFLAIIGSLLALWLFPNFIWQAAEILRNKPGKSFLFGILYCILVPFVMILCFVTVIGIPLWFFTLAMYIFSFVFAKLLVVTVFSSLIIGKYLPQGNAWKKLGVIIGLSVIIGILSGIDFIAALFVFWALLLLIAKKYSGSEE